MKVWSRREALGKRRCVAGKSFSFLGERSSDAPGQRGRESASLKVRRRFGLVWFGEAYLGRVVFLPGRQALGLLAALHFRAFVAPFFRRQKLRLLGGDTEKQNPRTLGSAGKSARRLSAVNADEGLGGYEK